jgi:hypothetical protein
MDLSFLDPLNRPARAAASLRGHALASGPDFGFLGLMDENTGAAQKSPREERLAKALRDNLRRRKAQARERAAGSDSREEAGDPAAGVSGHEG